MTEEKAIEGCKKNDRICQKYLFDTYSEGMLLVCMRYVKNLQDAEEMMLNGFYKFFNSIDRFIYNGKGSIGGWMKKIMVNECLMLLRKGKLDITNEQYANDITIDDNILAHLSANEIFRLVMELPAGCRTVFNLFAIEGMAHKEIAKELGISEGTSKSQLNKARAQLQQAIKKQNEYHGK